jgi:uncharacterized membrane-anchored protein YhcB (DUF1043 family)
MSNRTDYRVDASSDAADFVENFIDEVVEQLIDEGEASDDFLNDYPNGDSYHHESHVDKSYNLTEAAAVLDELRDYEETDSGLWEGLAPREAILAQAAYTYGAAVYFKAQDIIKAINSDDDLEELLECRGLDVDDAQDDESVGTLIERILLEQVVTQKQFDDELKKRVTARVKELISDNR